MPLSAASVLRRALRLCVPALTGAALVTLGSCVPKISEEDAQEPIIINGVSVPSAVYLTQRVPITVAVGGTPGKTASWNFTAPAGGGTFSPATGSVTLDGTGSATISSAYIAPTVGPGSYTSQLSLLRDSGFSANADIPITVLVPTVSIAVFSAPPYLRNGVTAPLNIFLQGTPGFTVTWNLSANRGNFTLATGNVVLSGGLTQVISSYTLPANTAFGTSLLTLQPTLVATAYSAPPMTIASTTATGVALFANTGNDLSLPPASCGNPIAPGGFVDYCPGLSSSEASNLEATLTGQGFAVTTFTGLTAADFAAAIQTKAVLALPEMEQGSLGTALLADATATGTIVQWVQGGGVLLISHPSDWPDDLNWLNSAFGYILAWSGGVITGNRLPITGPFGAGPATIPYNNDTIALVLGTLPGGSQIIYQEATSLDAMATVIPYGSGRIVILGWDWFDSNPPDTALGQDSGWLQVLQTAVTSAESGLL